MVMREMFKTLSLDCRPEGETQLLLCSSLALLRNLSISSLLSSAPAGSSSRAASAQTIASAYSGPMLGLRGERMTGKLQLQPIMLRS